MTKTDLLGDPPAEKGRAFSHERKSAAAGNKDEWLTPPELIRALVVGCDFDLDPCAPVNRPWDTAQKHYTVEDDGLSKPWHGRVWMNPPYGRDVGRWIRRLAEHGNGIALIFARPDTAAWQDWIFPRATGVYFLRGRLAFYHADGTRAGNAGAPSALVAYGHVNCGAILLAEDRGDFRGTYIPLPGNPG